MSTCLDPVLHPETEILHWLGGPSGVASWRDVALCGERLPTSEETDEDGMSTDPQWNDDVTWGIYAAQWCLPCMHQVAKIVEEANKLVPERTYRCANGHVQYQKFDMSLYESDCLIATSGPLCAVCMALALNAHFPTFEVADEGDAGVPRAEELPRPAEIAVTPFTAHGKRQ